MYTGTVDINKIKLTYDKWILNPPSEKKMIRRRKEYEINNKLEIVVREGTLELLEGFTYYTLALELKLNEVTCTYIEKDELFLSGNVKDEDRIKTNIYKNAHYTCYICGDKVHRDTGRDNINLATIDHFVPKARGGYSNEDNLKCCCRFCNALKGNILYDDKLVNYIKKEKKLAKENHIKTVNKYKIFKKQLNMKSA